jgi:hypothetical protein
MGASPILEEMKLVAFFFLISISALAQTPPPTPLPEAPVENTLKPAPPEKRFVIVGQPVGIGPGYVYTIGGSFGFFLAPNLVLLVDTTIGLSHGATMDNDASSGSNTEASSAGIHLKHFTNKWLYVRGGIDQRNVKWNYTNKNNVTKEVVSAQRFEANSVGATFAIGSQWTFRKFTFGADWVGLYYPFTATVHTEELVGPSGPNSLRDMREEEDKQIRGFQPLAARIYAGMSW